MGRHGHLGLCEAAHYFGPAYGLVTFWVSKSDFFFFLMRGDLSDLSFLQSLLRLLANVNQLR
jgi:hypothetical protein